MISAEKASELGITGYYEGKKVELNLKDIKLYLDKEVRRCAGQGHYALVWDEYISVKTLEPLKIFLESKGYDVEYDDTHFQFWW